MGKLNFCANIAWLFKEAPLLERYQLAADAGFLAVEDAWPYQYQLEDVVKAKDSAGVQQILINTGSSNDIGNGSNSANPQAFRDELDLAIHYANGLSCKKIHIMAGNVRENDTKQHAFETFVENLRYAGDKLNAHGIVGLIEPLNTISAPNYTFSTRSEALDALQLVDKPNILYQLDFFHLQIMEGNLTRNLKENLSKIGHIQVSQVPGRNEPSSAGEISYPYIFSLLEDLGYDGWIGCEYNPSTSTNESLLWFKDYMNIS